MALQAKQPFPTGFVVDARFADHAEMAGAGPLWRRSQMQLGPGRFRGRLVAIHTAGLQMAFSTKNRGVLLQGHPPPGAVVLGFMHGGDRIMLQGQPWKNSDLGVAHGGKDLELRVLGGHSNLTISVDRDLFESAALDHGWGPLLESDLGERVRITSPAALRALTRTWYGVMANSLHHPEDLRDFATTTFLQDVVLGALFRATDVGSGPLGRLDGQHRRLAWRTEEYLRSRMEDSVSVDGLVTAIGACKRSLHLAFRHTFGMTPMAYFRQLRLNAARCELRRGGTTVGEIAMRFGFFHLGRFALDYRLMFGEAPNEALRRHQSKK
jgi:AraC family ethanolamine operon transcriptional activator